MKSRQFSQYGFIILAFCLWGFTLSAQDATHIMAKGETLYSVAKHNGISLQDIEKANGINDPSKIRIGQKIIIPTRSSKDHQESVTTSIATKYTVKKGDTLYSIARNTGTDLAIILGDNKLGRTSTLKIGQQLIVRGLKTNSETITEATPIPVVKPDPKVVESTAGDLSGQVTTGTSFQKTAYTQGATLNWPHPGERYTLNGKLPGILIKAQKGEVVKSVNNGKVVYSGPHSTFGHIVFVQSADGFIYIYGGNESSSLKFGEIVHTGDIIGTVGITPGIQEPQVYFSIWKDGSYVNPASVLRS